MGFHPIKSISKGVKKLAKSSKNIVTGAWDYVSGQDFSAAQTKDQMKFQERMRDTAYQAAVTDMEKAGINPILAYKQGGAATPGGASASGVNMATTVADGISKVTASAIAAKKMKAELDILSNTRDKSLYDAEIADSNSKIASTEAWLTQQSLPFNSAVNIIKNKSPTLQMAEAWQKPASSFVNSAVSLIGAGRPSFRGSSSSRYSLRNTSGR